MECTAGAREKALGVTAVLRSVPSAFGTAAFWGVGLIRHG